MFYFYPYLGKIPILTNIFQGGWNHQPVIDGTTHGWLGGVQSSLFFSCQKRPCPLRALRQSETNVRWVGAWGLEREWICMWKNHLWTFRSVPKKCFGIHTGKFLAVWIYGLREKSHPPKWLSFFWYPKTGWGMLESKDLTPL